ncbi:MAG: MarR family winged helix-turn-helix transcriptional regulator [Candidatus Hodarchaeales archaeon]|jgi:DNA-binding MarR family transcriptional regulator
MKPTINQLSELNYEEGSIPEIFSIVNKITKNLDKFQRLVLSKTQLTPPQYSVLNTLGILGEDGLTLSQLAKACYSSPPTMTHLIDTLEKKKVVKRVPNPDDRRSLLVKLTLEGNSAIKEAPSVKTIYADCCSILNPEEKHDLSLLLKKLNRALKGFLE